jgi:hypothetical protein
VPTKLKETRNPPSVALKLKSLSIAGNTVGRITRSIEVIRMAPVVIISIHHEIE